MPCSGSRRQTAYGSAVDLIEILSMSIRAIQEERERETAKASECDVREVMSEALV